MGRELKVIYFLFVILFSISLAFAVTPSGATSVNVVSSQTNTPDAPTSVNAQAGNVTELNVFGYSVTQSWQGYFGNVSGTIQLADASDKVLYNWSLADPEGEIYASTSDAVNWANIACFDWATNGANLESTFNIDSNDVDGVNETFSYSNGHDVFYVNNHRFDEGQCMSTKIFDSSGSGVDDHFEEVLLWDGSNVVFTSLLEESSVLGFDGRDHDFEMIVLEDGHGTNTDVTTYYFYVELQ